MTRRTEYLEDIDFIYDHYGQHQYGDHAYHFHWTIELHTSAGTRHPTQLDDPLDP